MLADAAGEGAAGVLCLGDLVGYGADPVACVELLGERAAAVVGGNHEHGALGLLDLDWFNPYARAAAHWTRARSSASDHRRYLERAPADGRPSRTRRSCTPARAVRTSGTT